MDAPTAGSRSLRRWLLAYIAVFAVLAGAKAYTDRYTLNPDAVSYLDMADRLLEGKADPLHHPYWSPLYPVALAAGFKIFRTSPDSEFPVLHLVNWFLFTAMAFVFAWLLRRLWGHLSAAEPALARDRWFFPIWAAFCFAVLWQYGSQFLALSAGNPDTLVAIVTFAAAALACKFWSLEGTVISAAALGIVLSAGYYAKAAMLPIGILLLATLAVRAWSLRRTGALLALSAAIFLLLSAPLIVGISRAQHHLTFGEAGKVNYAWAINHVTPQSGWTGGDPSSGTPAHPPRVIVDKPRTLEFAAPVPGTNPLWYDPAYWYEGANTGFNLRGEVRALMHDAGFFSDLFNYSLIEITVLIVLALVRKRSAWQWRLPFLVIWPALVVGMYALVVLETRYVVPFLVLLFIGIIQMLVRGRARSVQKAVLLTAALLIALPAFKDALKAAGPLRRSPSKMDTPGNVEAAHQLHSLGLQSGEAIGVIDTGFDFYFAHMAGLRITTAVYEPDIFWTLDDAGQVAVLQAMARAGARAVVARKPATQCAASSLWRPLGGSGYIAWFSRSPASSL